MNIYSFLFFGKTIHTKSGNIAVLDLLNPATKKMAGYYVIPYENVECPYVSASFPDSNLSSF